MKKLFSIILILFYTWNARSEDAPIVQAGIVLNAPVTPSVTTVPVTVKNFTDIGSFTLSLDYDSAKVMYTGFTPNAIFTGMAVTMSAPGGTTKRLTITWPAIGQGITLPDQSVMLNLSVKYTLPPNGTRNYSYLTWYNNGSACQFTRYAGGTYLVLTDTPTESFYLNGAVTNHSAPYTTAPTITSATPGQVSVPITVTNCSNIGSVALTMEYNPNVLTYLSFTQNSAVLGAFSIGSNFDPATGITTLNMGWYGSPFGLSDGSTLLTLLFTYSNSGTGNYSELIFQTSPNAASEFSDGQYHLLYDAQPAMFYTNGLVAGQLSPRTWLPSFTEASPSSSLQVPVKVSAFNNISSFNLSFKYDPAVLTYNSATPNAALNGLLNVVNQPIGSDGKRTIALSWTGTSPLTLTDQSALVTLDFTYISSTTTLSWVVDDNTSCRFKDALGNSFYNKPKSTYFRDGLAASHLAPRTAAWYASPSAGQAITIPVLVFDYSNIGLFSLTLDYDPAALTFLNASLVPAIGGSFTATSPGPGRITMNWTGTVASLADSTTLINLNFTYNSGETALAWYDNGTSCHFAESPVSTALYDQPKAVYYVNGYVGPSPLVANFTASNTMPLENVTVTLTNQSTGSPTSYYWVISPPNADFVSGTTANSQHPQVRFTTNGAYTVTLIEYRGQAGGIKVKTDYIHVGSPGIWTGIFSTDWFLSSNWHNYMVPTGITNVLIPASAPHWPVFIGNFVVGTHCQNLRLEGGGNCIMTVRPD